MSIMDSFRNFVGNANVQNTARPGVNNQQMPAQVNYNPQQAPQQPAQPGGVNNPANPQGNQPPQRDPNRPPMEPKGENSTPLSLDDFSDLWQQPKDDKGQPVKQQDGKFQRPKLDRTKLQPVIDKMDFTSGLNPELVQKALGGDGAAFIEVLNHVGRQGFSASFNAGENYHGNLLEQYDNSLNERLPKTFDSLQSRQFIQESDNGILNHPAVAPFVDNVRSSFEKRYPDASPREISTATANYFKSMAKQLNSSQSQSDNGNNAGNQNGPIRGTKPSLVVSDFEGFEDNNQSGNQQRFG